MNRFEVGQRYNTRANVSATITGVDESPARIHYRFDGQGTTLTRHPSDFDGWTLIQDAEIRRGEWYRSRTIGRKIFVVAIEEIADTEVVAYRYEESGYVHIRVRTELGHLAPVQASVEPKAVTLAELERRVRDLEEGR